MDLAHGARRIYVAMEHSAKGSFKIVKNCSLPLTAKRCVHHIVTDLCFLDVTKDGLLLRELAPGVTVEEVQKLTEPKLIVSPDLKTMAVA